MSGARRDWRKDDGRLVGPYGVPAEYLTDAEKHLTLPDLHDWVWVPGVPWALDREGRYCRVCGMYEGEER